MKCLEVLLLCLNPKFYYFEISVSWCASSAGLGRTLWEIDTSLLTKPITNVFFER